MECKDHDNCLRCSDAGTRSERCLECNSNYYLLFDECLTLSFLPTCDDESCASCFEY
jgi:hypothetical protein